MKKTIKPSLQKELRKDILTEHWVVVTDQKIPMLEQAPEFPINETYQRDEFPILPECFRGLFFQGYPKPTIIETVYEKSKKPFLYIVPSEFPILSAPKTEDRYFSTNQGPFVKKKAFGVHELMIFEESKRIYDFSQEKISLMLESIQKRYLTLAHQKEINCLFWYHTYGQSAGAAFQHTHAQIVGLPVIPEFIEEKFYASQSYYQTNKRSVYEVMLEYELEQQSRVVYETDDFALICPFASRSAFEMMIIPKDHNPFYERILLDERKQVAELMVKGLRALQKTFAQDIDFNIYLYSAPLDGNDYKYFRWHLSIIPYLYKWEGLEMGAGMDICEVFPEVATTYLKRFFGSR